MKKIKLIAPILGAAATLGTAVPLAACEGGSQSQEVFIVETRNTNEDTREFVMLPYEVLQASKGNDFSIAINFVDIYESGISYLPDTITGMVDGKILHEQSSKHPNGFTIDYEKSGINRLVINVPWENFNNETSNHSLGFYLFIDVLGVDGSITMNTFDKVTAPFPGDTTFYAFRSAEPVKPDEWDYYSFTLDLKAYKEQLAKERIKFDTNQPLQFVVFGVKNQERINLNASRFSQVCYGANVVLTATLSNRVVTINPPEGGWGDEAINFIYQFGVAYPDAGVQAYIGIPEPKA